MKIVNDTNAIDTLFVFDLFKRFLYSLLKPTYYLH